MRIHSRECICPLANEMVEFRMPHRVFFCALTTQLNTERNNLITTDRPRPYIRKEYCYVLFFFYIFPDKHAVETTLQNNAPQASTA